LLKWGVLSGLSIVAMVTPNGGMVISFISWR
jgi:hypothetical protein